MNESGVQPGPSCAGERPPLQAPPPVINIIAPIDSPTFSDENSFDASSSHQPADFPGSSASAHGVNNSDVGLQQARDDFKFVDFSKWSSESTKGLGLGLSTVQVQQPFDSLTLPNNNERTEFIGKAKKRRFHCRRGAVVLQRSPVGRFFQGERKLRLAAQQGDYNEVLRLLDDGINPNRGDDKGRTALHFAITKGFREIVQLLLDKGADVNQKDGIGNTPLHLAAIGSHISMVTTLLQAGATVHVLDRGGHTPFHLALSRLEHLRANASLEGIQLRQEILQIMGMLRVYVSCRGQQENAMQLEQMSLKLRETDKKEEVDVLQDMLEGFTKMNLTKQ